MNHVISMRFDKAVQSSEFELLVYISYFVQIAYWSHTVNHVISMRFDKAVQSCKFELISQSLLFK